MRRSSARSASDRLTVRKQIDVRHDRIGVEKAEGAGGIDLAHLGDVGDAEHRDQRTVLHHGHEVVAERRQDGADRLRKDDVAEAAVAAKPQGLRGLDLARIDRLDAGAETSAMKAE